MDRTIAQISIGIKADTEKLISGMQRAELAVRNSVDRMKKTLYALVSAYAVVKSAMSIKEETAQWIETAAEFERFRAVLTTLSGSSIEAKKSMDWIKDFTKKTPYQMAEVVEAFIKLKSYGIDATKELKTLGDTAAAMGKPLDQAVEALADAMTGEFERLKEFGIKASSMGDKVKFSWIDASNNTKSVIVQNNTQIIESTLQAIWNEKYAGAMQNISHTWSGIVSNIKDDWTLFKSSVMDNGILNYLKAVASEFEKRFGNTLKNNLHNTQSAIMDFIQELKKAILFLASIDDAIGDVSKILYHSVLMAADIIGAGLMAIPAGIEKMINGVIGLLNSFIQKLPPKLQDFFGIGKIEKLHTYGALLDEFAQKYQEHLHEVATTIQNITKPGDIAQYWQEFFDDVEKRYKQFAHTVTKTHKNSTNTIKTANNTIAKDLYTKLIAKEQVYLAYLEAVGKKEEAFWIKEGNKINKLLLAGLDSKKALDVLNADYAKFKVMQERVAKDTQGIWANATIGLQRSFEQNFFDYMTGRFKSFKDFFKNILNDILSNLVTPFSKSLSGLISGALRGIFGGVQGGIVNQFYTRSNGPSLAAQFVQAGWKALGDGVYQNSQGQKVVIEKNGQIQAFDAQGGLISNLASVAALPSTIKAAGGFLANPMGFINNLALMPAMSVAKIGTMLEGIPVVGGALSQGAYGFSTLLAGGNPAIYGTAGMAGATLGAGALGYLGGTILDKLFGADTHAGVGGGIGAAIGTMIAPGIGSVLGGLFGSVLGGLFGKTKKTGQESGVDIFGTASAESVRGREWLVEHFKKKSWFSSKRWDVWHYKGFIDRQIEAIKQVIGTFDSLLWMMGDFGKRLKVQGGRFKNIEQFLSTNVVKAFLKEVMNLGPLAKTIQVKVKKWTYGWWSNINNSYTTVTKKVLTEDGKKLNRIYQIWKDYAKSVSKKVYEAFNDVVNDYIKSKRSFAVWYQNFRGNSLEALKLQAKFAEEDLIIIQQTIGQEAANITIGNYLQAYEKAVKSNFTPQVIQQWKALGEALMNASEAEKKYQEALTGRDGTVAILSGKYDMLMGRAIDATRMDVGSIVEAIQNGNEEMKLLFFAILKELKKQTAIEQGLQP